MWQRLALIVPSIGDVRVLTGTPGQTCPVHTQTVEVGFSQIANVQPEPLLLTSVLNRELQQYEPFSRIAELGSRVEMNAQLLIRFDEPEVAETCRMRQAHLRGDLFPARIGSEVLI